MTHDLILNSLGTVMDKWQKLGIPRKSGIAKLTRWLSVSLVLGLAACAGSGVKQDAGASAQAVVAKLAQSRWDALVRGDLDKAYEFLSPGTRAVTSLDLYKKKTRSGMWKKVDVESVSCEQVRCEVKVVVEYNYRNMGLIETHLDEVWLQEGDNWWFVPRR